MKILLNKNRGKLSTNEDNYAELELGNQTNKVSNRESYHLVDLYQMYLDEKDESDKYRLIITINPVCSNILFNAITEAVYKEGSDECFALVGDKVEESWTDRQKYPNIISTQPLNRWQAMQDTEYSNPYIMGLDYLPGIDIFNNHLMRQENFASVMKRTSPQPKMSGAIFYLDDSGNTQKAASITDTFNTIRDYQRNMEGGDKTATFPGTDSTYGHSVRGVPHLYHSYDLTDFQTTFQTKLKEKGGWFGFYNPSTIDIPIGKNEDDVELYINKLINGKRSCEFIDMFPDRSRFTFVPQLNKYRDNRLERNWEYCLTYPYAVTEYLLGKDGQPLVNPSGNVLNPIVAERDASGYTRNGLGFMVVGDFITDSEKHLVMLQSTGSIHNLQPKDVINIYYLDSGECFSGILDVDVVGIGDKDGEMVQYYFAVSAEDVPDWFYEDGELNKGIRGRFCKTAFGIECEYYFRVFRRLPNFKYVPNEDDRTYVIGEYNKPEYEFDSEMNSLAFANNIYGDRIVQLVYLDDIDVAGITDEFERPLSDIYLTIVKTNDGHELWYPESGTPDYRNENITIARCFGKVTSGIDLPYDHGFSMDYNVHRINNVDAGKFRETYTGYTNPGLVYDNVNASLGVLEDDIKIEDEFFLGDMIEFSPSQYMETVLEQVYHRFNTAQREYVNLDYADIVTDEIYTDDYEGSTGETSGRFDSKFKCVEDIYNKGEMMTGYTAITVTYPGNILPEGYYYQPHYRIHLRDVSDKISQTSDSFVQVIGDVVTGSTNIMFTAATENDLSVGDWLTIQDSVNNLFYDAIITGTTSISDSSEEVVAEIYGAELNAGMDVLPKSFIIFKKTLGVPKYAIHYPDTGGKYIWRALVPNSKVSSDSEIYDKPFVNGAHYRNIGINFFLKRQDPFGEYELNRKTKFSTGTDNKLVNFTVNGTFHESIYYNDAINFGLLDIC